MGGNRGIRAKLMEYFAKHPGEHVFLNDLKQVTGLSTDQVQGNITNIMRDHRLGKFDFNVVRIASGQIWMYKPNEGKPDKEVKHEEVKHEEVKHEKRIFEELGTTKRGTLVLQDNEGKLFEATEL